MKRNIFKLFSIVIVLALNGTIQAQSSEFLLQDRYKGFETKDGKGFIEIEIRDSANIDSYISRIYSTLAESYPRANIQVIGNRLIRMDATSLGMTISQLQVGTLELFVDFSIVIEVREHPDQIYYYTDSLGVKHSYNDRHHVRISAPVVKKLTAYNPYYKSEVKEYITKTTEMHDALMEKDMYGTYGSLAKQFLSEIDLYIIGNIRAELCQNYYRTFDNGRGLVLTRKHKRSE